MGGGHRAQFSSSGLLSVARAAPSPPRPPLHQPDVHELTSSLRPLSFSPPLSFDTTSPLSTSQTNYPTNSPSLPLSQTFPFNSVHFHIVTSTVYLAFIWHLLEQMVCWLRNTLYPCEREYVRSALHMLGLNSTSSLSPSLSLSLVLSLKGITLILFAEEAM